MNLKNIIIGLIGFIFPACFSYCHNQMAVKDYTSYVNPLIGSGGHGHVFVGASLPHGMVQLGPNNISKGWDWCSGYHNSDSTIIGFSHTHLSGTGIADLADILFMPVTDLQLSCNDSLPSNEYASLFQKKNQLVRPGYYSVILDKYQIKAELTATLRVGVHRYTFPKGGDASVIIDLNEGAQSLMSRKGTLGVSFVQINDTTIAGYRYSNEWASDHKVYFTTVFSCPIRKSRTYKEGDGLTIVLDFEKLDQSLLAKTGISYVSEAGAGANLISEMPDWNFEKVRSDATDTWNNSLSKICFQADSETMNIFYTALYHTMIAPSLFSDVDGQYRGADQKKHVADTFTPYTTFSLWDTYRAVHPLYTLIDEHVSDYVNSLLSIYEQQKRLPVWPLVGNETDCMVGIHSVPVIVDACLKGFKGIDLDRAYRAVSSIENMNSNGLDYVRDTGFIPADKVSWSVARALEYAIDDYSVAQLGYAMGKMDDYHKFESRSKYYANYFDSNLGFMRGKLADGTWRKNFDPSHSIHMEDDYVEGNAWQYTWLVPHDVKGMVDLFGSKEKFAQKLDSLFLVSSELNEGASVDITGMIGQYAHGNEPSHHTLYLYTLVGQPQRTAELVRRVCDEFYTTEEDGLIGNEDCGQMSAWYVLSSLGFYPVNPVDGNFVFGSPLLDEATIRLNNGKTLILKAYHNNKENRYIASIRLNGELYKHNTISYKELMGGGILEYEMTNNPK